MLEESVCNLRHPFCVIQFPVKYRGGVERGGRGRKIIDVLLCDEGPSLKTSDLAVFHSLTAHNTRAIVAKSALYIFICFSLIRDFKIYDAAARRRGLQNKIIIRARQK